MYTRASKGFTLIELLVVISIISLLSSVVLTSVQSARVKARDAQRITTLVQLERAIELYRSNNSSYPYIASPGACFGSAGNCTNVGLLNGGNTLQTLLSSYLAGGVLPQDPKPWLHTLLTDRGYRYVVESTNPQRYCLYSYSNIENMNNVPLKMRSPLCAANSSGYCNSETAPWSNRAFVGDCSWQTWHTP